MGREARYLVRLANSGPYGPADCERLLQKMRKLINTPEASLMNLRVSRSAIEFDLFCGPAKNPETFLTLLGPIGPLLTIKRLDAPPPWVVAQAIIADARALFNEERYWEVHEVLEGLWRKTQGSEKELLQGLILAAAALVHAQKNQWKVVWPMLGESARRLQGKPAKYYGLDVGEFLKNVKKAVAAKNVNFPTI